MIWIFTPLAIVTTIFGKDFSVGSLNIEVCSISFINKCIKRVYFTLIVFKKMHCAKFHVPVTIVVNESKRMDITWCFIKFSFSQHSRPIIDFNDVRNGVFYDI